MKLEKRDLDVIANSRANRVKLVKVLMWVWVGYSLAWLIGLYLYTELMLICIPFWPLGAIAIVSIMLFAIVPIIVQYRKQKEIRKQLEEEYLAENTGK